MLQRNYCACKTSGIVIAGFDFLDFSRTTSDFATIVKEVAIQAGAPWVSIGIAGVGLAGEITEPFWEEIKNLHPDVFITNNPVHAVRTVQTKLQFLERYKDCNFGLAITVSEQIPNKRTVGIAVLKRPNYLPDISAAHIPEGIVCSVLFPNSQDVVKETLDIVNRELHERSEPSLCLSDIQVVTTLAQFFQALKFRGKLVLLVWNDVYSQSSLLIQT